VDKLPSISDSAAARCSTRALGLAADLMRHVRANYIEAFTNGFARLKADGPEVHAEIRLELKGPRRNELYQLVVVDAVRKDADGAITTVDFRTSPVVATYPGLPIASPIAWQTVTFRCGQLGFPEPDLIAWGSRWIHDEAPPLGPQDGFTGIIHSVSQPETHDGLVEFNVDFGTAPFDAFEELTALLKGHVEVVYTSEEREA
jgi:hypothetical protein